MVHIGNSGLNMRWEMTALPERHSESRAGASGGRSLGASSDSASIGRVGRIRP